MSLPEVIVLVTSDESDPAAMLCYIFAEGICKLSSPEGRLRRERWEELLEYVGVFSQHNITDCRTVGLFIDNQELWVPENGSLSKMGVLA